MITPAYARTMAAYNAEMNRRLFAAATRLPDQERRHDRGAFWHSIHGTLVHLLWADRVWMARFDGWTRLDVPLPRSDQMIQDFDELARERPRADAEIEAWAARLTPEWLAQDLVWFSGSTGKERRENRAFLVTHFFNHQTHHRGQAHAMITACGENTGDTDLMLVVKPR